MQFTIILIIGVLVFLLILFIGHLLPKGVMDGSVIDQLFPAAIAGTLAVVMAHVIMKGFWWVMFYFHLIEF